MSQRKDWLVDRLERLVKLTRATEPDKPDDEQLFTTYNVEAYGLLSRVEDHYESLSNTEVRDLMVRANNIWNLRRKVWNGEIDQNQVPEMQLIVELEDMLAQNMKIAAIKHYRANAKIIFGQDKSLRESKDFVDDLEKKMVQRGAKSK